MPPSTDCFSASQLLMPALQARRLRLALVVQVCIAQGKDLVGGGARHQVHEDREVARLRQSSLSASTAPMLWWYAASKREHHMLECPGKSSSEEKPPLAADPVEDAARATSRDMKNSRWWAALLAAGPSLNRSGAGSIKTLSTAAATKRELGRNARDGPLVRHGPDKARKICPGIFRVVRCAWNQAGNPLTRHAEPAAFQVAEFRGICPVATCEPRDHRTSHTRRRPLTPPCLPAGGQQFCGPQSRQAGAVALQRLPRVARSGCWQRAQMRPEALSTNGCPRLQMVGSASNGRDQGRSRSRCLSVARPCPGNQVESMSMLSRGATARNPIRHARDGRNGCGPRFADVRRSAVFQNYQLAGCIGQVVPSPIIGRDDASQHRHRSGARTPEIVSIRATET